MTALTEAVKSLCHAIEGLAISIMKLDARVKKLERK
jgi:hypothetical protein